MVLPLHKSLESVLKVCTFLLMGAVLSSNVIIYIYLTLQEHDETQYDRTGPGNVEVQE